MPFYLSDTGMAELLRNLKASSKSFMIHGSPTTLVHAQLLVTVKLPGYD